jgi:hypothetical protein
MTIASGPFVPGRLGVARRHRAGRLLPAGLAGLVVLALLGGMLGSSLGQPVPSATAAPPTTFARWRPDHVVVVVLENKGRKSVIGSSDAPYLSELARRGANLTRS